MKRGLKIVLILWGVLLLATLWTTQAKSQEEKWPSPLRLSAEGRKASEGSIVADKYGYVHLFWREEMEDGRTTIQYARFDGETWSTPFDIYVTAPDQSINSVSSFVDRSGTLHIVWTEGITQRGPAYYSSAPSHDALSAKNWQQPIRIDIPAKEVNLLVDSQGIIHLLYVKSVILETSLDGGLYYVRSPDQGKSWSDPTWIDRDIPPDYAPRSVHFDLDDKDGLHAAWYYSSPLLGGGDWIRYVHSLDGGITWSLPFTIDKVDQHGEGGNETGGKSTDYQLSAASPVMIVQGQTIHIIWAGGKLHYRHHRFSTDGGQTWSVSHRFMADLNGQAFDGVTVDSWGRIHYFAQIRFPKGIYHAYWDKDHWTTPSLIYLISWSSSDGTGEAGQPDDKIEAHNTHPTIRAGNQLILSFTDPPPESDRGLYVMQYTMPDMPASAIEPIPVPTATPIPTSVPSPTSVSSIIKATQTPAFTDSGDTEITELPDADNGFIVGMIIPLSLIGGVVGVRMWLRSRY